ncbi:MAG: nucleoside triphosphate pyrophosphohydrolase [Erythrobacter sp.]
MADSAPSSQIDRILSIMEQLRNPNGGCDWDLAQTFETIAPYTIEEAYEVADAIEQGDMSELKDELGDLLLQVVFHARIAQEAGHFEFEDVARSISDKMEARHPHVFGQAGGNMGETRWENLKDAERSDKGATSALDGVALALPALMRAQKLQKRAARTGFDWPDPSGAEAKIAEEIAEFKEATSAEHKVEEAGDMLFAVVNFLRAHGIAAEDALRAANGKFERRFRGMETFAEGGFPNLSLDQQEALWQRVKSAENKH